MKDILIKVLYALPVYQSVVLALLLFIYSGKTKGFSRLLMGCFQAILALYFTFNFLYSLKAYSLIAGIYVIILPAILLFVPLFYLFILSAGIPGFRPGKKQLFHFLPALLIFFLNTPFLIVPQTGKLLYVTFGFDRAHYNPLLYYLLAIYSIGVYVVFNFQIVIYAVLVFRLYKKHKSYIANRFSYTENISLNWTLALIFSFILFFVINEVLYLVGFRQHILSLVFYNVSMLAISLFAGYRGMLQKDLGEAEVRETITAVSQEEFLPEEEQIPGVEKYAGSALTPGQKQVLIRDLEQLMEQEKLFMNNDLSVEDVALRLNTRTKYISQIINEHHKKNFYNFINYYRVEEAKRLLRSAENEKYSILGIAQSVGFVSKSTFNAAFKRITGQTPSEFKKQSFDNN